MAQNPVFADTPLSADQAKSVGYEDVPLQNDKAAKPSTNTGLAMVMSTHLMPLVQDAINRFATNPDVAKAFATGGRIVGGITSLPAGLSGFGDVQKGAYAGGRSGYFTGKLAQDVVRPVANVVQKVTDAVPSRVMTVANVVGGVQSGLDLAQMAEPNRTDIGFMGMGRTPTGDELKQMAAQQETPEARQARQDKEAAAWNGLTQYMHPAVVTELLGNIRGAIASAVAKTQALAGSQ